jgi:hypothetical protein
MTKQECAIIMAHTGICMLTGEEFNEFHKYVEYIMGRPVWTHELANEEVKNEIIENSKDDFLDLCKEAVTDGWIKCEDRLPEDSQYVLVYYEYDVGEDKIGIYDVLSGNTIKISKEKGKRINVIAWRPLPNYEGEIQPEEELPFK